MPKWRKNRLKKKTTMKFHLTPVKMAIIKKKDDNQYWWKRRKRKKNKTYFPFNLFILNDLTFLFSNLTFLPMISFIFSFFSFLLFSNLMLCMLRSLGHFSLTAARGKSAGVSDKPVSVVNAYTIAFYDRNGPL